MTSARTQRGRKWLAALVLGGTLFGLGAFFGAGEAQAIIGRPLTPFSFAGVARRTTRRAVYGGAYGGYGYGGGYGYAPPAPYPYW
jgi:hypothetical protein